MHATPIIPGQSYRVHGLGIDRTVAAKHGCDAICQILARVLPCAA